MTLEDFEARAIPEPNTGCLLWTAIIDHNGYAIFKRPHRIAVARWIYSKVVRPMRQDEEPDHRCRNRQCVEVRHIEAVSRHENNLRSNSWSGKNARKTVDPQGHPYDFVDSLGRRRCRRCCAEADRRYKARKAGKPMVAA